MRFAKTLPLSKLQEKGVLENDKLIVEVYINVVEAVDREGEGDEDVSKMAETKTVEINGFRVLASQSTSLLKLFAEHPDIAKDFKPKNQMVKTEYMNLLLNIIETLDKPSKNQSNNELGKASSDLSELMELGFKLDWLRSKLEKADDADGSRVKQLEESVKNLEKIVSDLKVELDKKKN